MLHKVNLPGCVPQLERIVEFQRDVLRAACEGDYVFPLDENQIKALFGDDAGKWFWGKLWRQPRKKNGVLPPKEKTIIHNSLEKLTAYYQKKSQEGIDTLNAFDNDIQFADHLDDPNFRFQYPNLQEANQKLIKPLMIAFYKDLLKSGFVEAIHGDSKKLDRDGFIASFWDKNQGLGVCPACDSRKSPQIGGKVFDDADHFLPKSKYPFLSLHPFNLFPLCIYCNRPIKGDKDIIDDINNAPLVNIFHPYKRPALEQIEVIVYRDQTGYSKLGNLIDKGGMPSRRLSNLNRVFKISGKWGGELQNNRKAIINEIIEAGGGFKNFIKNNNLILTPTEIQDELKASLERKVKTRKNGLGEFAGYILQGSYLNCALSDTEEFNELYQYYV